MRRRTILVVNDEPYGQDLWAHIFAEEGFKVLRARDAVEASKYLAVYRPAVALCNARTPGPDGIWLAEVIRMKRRATALVLVNGESDAELVTTVRRAIGWNSQPASDAH